MSPGVGNVLIQAIFLHTQGAKMDFGCEAAQPKKHKKITAFLGVVFGSDVEFEGAHPNHENTIWNFHVCPYL